jgi:hypothetical protein
MQRRSAAILVLLVAVAAFVMGPSRPAGATVVSNEAGLRIAVLNSSETSITLANSVELTDCVAGALTRTSPNSLVINGAGFTIHQTCAGKDLIDATGGGSLTFDHVLAQVDGADGITNTANVTVTDSTISGPGGDGIFASGPATTINLIRSLITDVANDGISAQGGASVSVVASTIDHSNNDGIFAQGGGVSLQNSTITASIGDGIATLGGGSVTLVYATLIDNGAGTVFHTGALSPFGSVIALASSGVNCSGGGTGSSQGFNFSDDTSCGLSTPTDHPAAGTPQLAALANNGGPTPTAQPAPGSPLIDVIPVGACGLKVDQRGFPRPSGAGCDIGAVEVQVAAPAPVPITPRFTG